MKEVGFILMVCFVFLGGRVFTIGNVAPCSLFIRHVVPIILFYSFLFIFSPFLLIKLSINFLFSYHRPVE